MEISVVKSITKQPADDRRVLKRSKLAAAIGMASVMFVAGMSGSAFAAKGGTPGKPVDGTPTDFGDLFILHRTVEDGIPYLTPQVGDTGLCQQPLASATCPTECKVSLVDGPSAGAVEGVLVDQATCAPIGSAGVQDCAPCTQEVEFGRINEARSPDTVFATQLEDAVVKLSTAHCRSLDPAGRPVASTDLDGEAGTEAESSTIDSPLQSLAIYRELMTSGSIGIDLPGSADVLTTAARALGAASDKAGKVNVDMVVYLNQIMGLTAVGGQSYLPTECITVREEVMGVVQLVQKCFLDYPESWNYARSANFAGGGAGEGLPYPEYIPEETPVLGTFEYLSEPIECEDAMYVTQGPIMQAVFNDQDATEEGITGFALAADDARAVIDYMHNWPVPGTCETPIPCDAPETEASADVSISDVSGLQVPKNLVDYSEGREFTVTVANGGPDAASGTVTVNAVAANGGAIISGDETVGPPWVYTFSDLANGSSEQFVQPFRIEVGGVTTISWTAAVTIDQIDPNPSNNTVTATSNVKTTGSGGGSGGGKPPGSGGQATSTGSSPGDAKGKP